jgi:hypothetical protein
VELTRNKAQRRTKMTRKHEMRERAAMPRVRKWGQKKERTKNQILIQRPIQTQTMMTAPTAMSWTPTQNLKPILKKI